MTQDTLFKRLKEFITYKDVEAIRIAVDEYYSSQNKSDKPLASGSAALIAQNKKLNKELDGDCSRLPYRLV